jgi:hypothetical protein
MRLPSPPSQCDFAVYLLPMRIVSMSVCLAGLLFASAAQGQHKFSPDAKEAIPYVKMATEVALNVQHNSLNNYLAVFVTYRDWDQAVKDGDLGPFMKLKEAEGMGGRSAVCLFSSKKDAAICVYFDDKRPFGLTTVKAGADGKLGDPAAGYQRVTNEMRKKNDQKLNYVESTVTTDYGAGLTGFQITTQ